MDDMSETAPSSFGVLDVVLWFLLLAFGFGVALWVRTLIIRQLNRQVEDHVTATTSRRKRSTNATRASFVEQTLTSYDWQSTNTDLEDQNNDSTNETECSICLSQFTVGDRVSKSNNIDCLHIFHRDCVVEWLIEHTECPMCRKEFLLPPMMVQAQVEHTDTSSTIPSESGSVEMATVGNAQQPPRAESSGSPSSQEGGDQIATPEDQA